MIQIHTQEEKARSIPCMWLQDKGVSEKSKFLPDGELIALTRPALPPRWNIQTCAAVAIRTETKGRSTPVSSRRDNLLLQV